MVKGEREGERGTEMVKGEREGEGDRKGGG